VVMLRSSMNFQRRTRTVEVGFQSTLNGQPKTQQEQQHHATPEPHKRLHRRVAEALNQDGTKKIMLLRLVERVAFEGLGFASLYSRDRGCRRRRSVFAVSFLNLRAHCLKTLALVHHFHHVTRDANADTSGEAHSIEDEIVASRAVLHITRCIARVALCAAATVTGDVAESIAV